MLRYQTRVRAALWEAPVVLAVMKIAMKREAGIAKPENSKRPEF